MAKPTQECAGLALPEQDASTDMVKLLAEIEQQCQSGDFSKRLTVESGSKIGQIAVQYNRMLDMVTRETSKAILMAEAAELSKQRTQQACEELQKLSIAVEQSAAAVVITSTDGTVEYVNPTFTKLTGYSAEEAIGLNPSVLKSGEMSPENYRWMWETPRAGDVWRGEFRNKKKNGELFWEAASISPVRNSDGEITHFLTVKEDITERKRLESEMLTVNGQLFAVNQVYTSLFDCTTHNDVAKTLTDALVQDFSAYFSRVWLIRPGDLCSECALAGSCRDKARCLHLVASTGYYTHIDGGHRRVPLGAFKIGLIAQGRGKTICNDVLNDGRVHDHEWAADHGLQSFAGFPLVRDHEVVGVMAMFSQEQLPQHLLNTLELLTQLGTSAITNIEKAQALSQSQDYASNILRSMIDTLFVVAPDGSIVTVNEATCRLLGYTEDELIGKPGRILFEHEEDLAQMIVSWIAGPVKGTKHRTLTDVGHVSDVESSYVTKDGSRIPVTFSGSVMRDAEGEVLGIVCVAQDSTERKQLQCELAHAQKLESVGQLAAGIAHEINTPIQYVGDNTRFFKDAFGDISSVMDQFEKLLRAAKGGTVDEQLVAEVEATLRQADVEYLTKEIPQAVDQSLHGVERVAKIVRAMKAFSHPDGEEKTLLNLKEAVETTITVARNEWKYVAEMVTEFDPELPQVSCLPGELNQVLLNLIVNAAHAIGDILGDDSTAKGRITVGTRRDGNWAEIFVRDTGTGIPEDVRARVFDPFFTTKEVGKGTGQGLAIAHSVVVDKHGGTINCETEQGKGTTFVVRLPIDE